MILLAQGAVALYKCRPSPFPFPKAMSNALIDLRPLEPDWVTSTRPELPDLAEWTVVRHPWNRETRRYDTVTVSGNGNSNAFLNVLAAILNSNDFECQITVDATRIDPDAIYPPQLNKINYPESYDLCLFWSIRTLLGKEESGYDVDELFSWVQDLLVTQQAFEIELSVDDPTP